MKDGIAPDGLFAGLGHLMRTSAAAIGFDLKKRARPCCKTSLNLKCRAPEHGVRTELDCILRDGAYGEFELWLEFVDYERNRGTKKLGLRKT